MPPPPIRTWAACQVIIRHAAGITPENRLLSKTAALNLIGSTLPCTVRGSDLYDTLPRCSEDGERFYSSRFKGAEGKVPRAESESPDALSLLSLGFGKPTQ